ncbi:MAG: glycosyltransferase family 2 protein [Clostridia bacterium]|nr:glycosyltransferase family 2 protein [Clostridia bacterium]
MSKKVSVLVPVYNVEKYLRRCIDSILKQTYENFELVLVDDCSTDNSLEICKEYEEKDNRIKVVKKPTHTVLSDVRNVGIENSDGDYLMFVDSDDYVCDNFVEEMVKAIEDNSVDVARCKAIKYKKNGTTEIESFYGLEGKVISGDEIKNIIPNFTTYNNNICCFTWSLIIRRDKLRVKFNPDVYCRQDAVFLIELLLKSVNSIYFLDMPLYHYCFNGSSITNDSSSYYRYIDGLLASDKAIRKTLKDCEYLDSELEKEMNNSVFIVITYKLATLSGTPIKNIRNTIKSTFNREEIVNIFNNMNPKSLRKNNKIKYYLVKFHLYFLFSIIIKNS